MEKEVVKSRNREVTERILLDAVDELIEEKGFENLGVNAVAAKANVSKMLIYRYFDSLDGLIAAYIKRHDFWINFQWELSEPEQLQELIKETFKKQICMLRENYTLRRLYRWELYSTNKVVKDVRDKREAKGMELINEVCRISGFSQRKVASLATLITSSITYLILLSENCPKFNGIYIQDEEGWKQLEEGIDRIVDNWFNDKQR